MYTIQRIQKEKVILEWQREVPSAVSAIVSSQLDIMQEGEFLSIRKGECEPEA